MNDHCNRCVGCTVQECRHHSDCEDYCTLDKVQIGTHEGNVTMDQCTDCKSFDRR